MHIVKMYFKCIKEISVHNCNNIFRIYGSSSQIPNIQTNELSIWLILRNLAPVNFWIIMNYDEHDVCILPSVNMMLSIHYEATLKKICIFKASILNVSFNCTEVLLNYYLVLGNISWVQWKICELVHLFFHGAPQACFVFPFPSLTQTINFSFASMLISLNFTLVLISQMFMLVRRTKSTPVCVVGHKKTECTREIWICQSLALDLTLPTILSSPVQVLKFSIVLSCGEQRDQLLCHCILTW